MKALDITRPADLDLVREAAALVIDSQFASQAFLQRELAVGPVTAWEVLKQLLTAGIVSPPIKGARTWQVTIPAGADRDQLVDQRLPLPGGAR